MREQITHAVSALLAAAAFYWRVESPQKRWTPERALFLVAAAISALWNVYAVVV
jgi:hypothetical protein